MENSGHYEYVGGNGLYLVGKDDSRAAEFVEFKSRNGFSPDECWSLYGAVSRFILPRLRHYREEVKSGGFCPAEFSDSSEWAGVLDRMIWSFELAEMSDSDVCAAAEALAKRKGVSLEDAFSMVDGEIDSGLALFARHFRSLWW